MAWTFQSSLYLWDLISECFLGSCQKGNIVFMKELLAFNNAPSIDSLIEIPAQMNETMTIKNQQTCEQWPCFVSVIFLTPCMLVVEQNWEKLEERSLIATTILTLFHMNTLKECLTLSKQIIELHWYHYFILNNQLNKCPHLQKIKSICQFSEVLMAQTNWVK